MRLSVNIDHIATLREARKIHYPDPVHAVHLIEIAGAHGITCHLRIDRRHIKERDIKLLKEISSLPLNVEVSLTDELLRFLCDVRPDWCCLVPERPEEITTEGGLDIIKFFEETKRAVDILKSSDIKVTIFIEPDKKIIEKAKLTGADAVEINTGKYSESKGEAAIREYKRIKEAAKFAKEMGFEVHGGHGLNYQNVKLIAQISEIEELSIGHSIISRAVFVGLERAVREMLLLIS